MAKLILILLEVFKEIFKRLGQDKAMMKLEGCWQAGAHGLVGGMWDAFADSGSNPEREKGRERGETERRAELANVSGMKS